jgi:uroporphyrinogen decarboxylase
VVGNLDMDLLIRGTPEENAAATERLLREFAPGGGYIFSSSNTLSYGVRPENVLAVSGVITGQERKAGGSLC